ncbi:hypothetical protein [Haloarchaeobius sp. DFWS5]|uniref:hypothetical protein n=1 Tax=Haloarchaeobius sp. DFWS5 TaxID=3446114 RepID=UPI003EB8240C
MVNRPDETRRHGMTVARDGVVVEKRWDVETLPLPAVSFDVVSERAEPVEVTVVERLPPGLSTDRIGLHPAMGADDWTCYDDGELVWRGVVRPREHRRTVVGVWLDSPETATSLLHPPTVEAVRVVDDAEPQVLDETFVESPQPGLADIRDGVAAAVPADALRATGASVSQTSDLPAAGEGLTPPTERDLDEVVAAVVGGAAVPSHDRFYHLRLAVETAGRGAREVSVLEDLTNALSVLYADADDRDGGTWRVLDVVIGTNWQAERIVTALGDDHRVAGLLVTELTGAIVDGRPRRPGTRADPKPDELASSMFGGESATDENAEEAATGQKPSGQETSVDGTCSDAADAQERGEPPFTATGPVAADTDSSVDEPITAMPPSSREGSAASDTGDTTSGVGDTTAETTDAPTETAEATSETSAVDDFGDAGSLDDFGTASSLDDFDGFEPVSQSPTSSDAVDADGIEILGPTQYDDDGLSFEDGDGADGDGTDGDGADGDDADDDTVDDAEAAFAELKAETEQASVADLDAELADMVLSPDDSEEYSIADLLAE